MEGPPGDGQGEEVTVAAVKIVFKPQSRHTETKKGNDCIGKKGTTWPRITTAAVGVVAPFFPLHKVFFPFFSFKFTIVTLVSVFLFVVILLFFFFRCLVRLLIC